MDLELTLHNKKIKGIISNEEARNAVILVHGFSGDMHGPDNLFDELATELANNDFAVIQFSFRGTDPSDGEQHEASLYSETEDLNTVIDWAENTKGYNKIAVVGESFGGGVVANAYTDILDAVIFWYPLFDFKDCSFREFLNDFNKEQLEKHGHIEIDEFMVGPQMFEDIENTVLYDRMKDITAPTLFLHGDSDTDVPVEQSQKAYELVPAIKEIGILEGADHCFRQEHDAAIELTLEFLKENFTTD